MIINRLLNNKVFYILLATLIGFFVAWENVGPVIFDDHVVQDDFRQSCFWFWQFWDSELFVNSFTKPLYEGHLTRTPVLNLIYHIAPLLTDNLIFFAKAFALTTSVIASIFAYLFFYELTKSRPMSLAFTLMISVCIWSTDHHAAAHTRTLIWPGLLVYMYFKQAGNNIASAITCFVLLLSSPIAFLMCLGMEFFNFVIYELPAALKGEFAQCRTSLISLFANGIATLLLYFVIFKDIKTMAVGESFSLTELKQLPELNAGGRHPIFDCHSFYDWWIHSQWGYGIGHRGIGYFLIVAIVLAAIYIIMNNDKSRIYQALRSQAMILIYSSVSLYIASIVLFPLLYMPNRYISISLLLVSMVALVLIASFLFNWIQESWNLFRGFAVVMVIIGSLSFWGIFRMFYKPVFVGIDPGIKAYIEELPKDIVVAAHPDLEDISLVSVTTKRMVYIDYERSLAYSQQMLDEIRRRTLKAFEMTYANNEAELRRLMQEEGISHFIAHKKFYRKQYLDSPRYMEPYNDQLKQIIDDKKNRGFFLKNYLKENLKDSDQEWFVYTFK